MRFRAKKEVKVSVNLEKKFVPFYELHAAVVDGCMDDLRELATLRGLLCLRETSPTELVLSTPKGIDSNEQAVWHFLLAGELMESELVKKAEILLIRESNSGKIQPRALFNQGLVLDSSVILFFLQAGFWSEYFDQAALHVECQKRLHLNREMVLKLFQAATLSSPLPQSPNRLTYF